MTAEILDSDRAGSQHGGVLLQLAVENHLSFRKPVKLSLLGPTARQGPPYARARDAR